MDIVLIDEEGFKEVPPEPQDFIRNKKPEHLYVSRPFGTKMPDGSIERKLRFVSEVSDVDEGMSFGKIKKEIVLHRTVKGRQEIKAVVVEDDREIETLIVQKISAVTGYPLSPHISFRGAAINKLIEFIKNIASVPFPDGISGRFSVSQLQDLTKLREELGEDMITALAETQVTKKDIISIAYRKEQLVVFERLLNDPGFFEEIKREWKRDGDEAVWQMFFEKNPWIFGYGLAGIFFGPLEGKKLEQLVKGADLSGHGKRVDAVLASSGLIGSIGFAEIKTHTTPLLRSGEYRPGVWGPSSELTNGVAQIHKTVQKSVCNLGAKVNLQDEDGFTKAPIFQLQPRSFLVIGKLSEFQNEHLAIHDEKFECFELFRKNLFRPEIITFDELYQRTRQTVLFVEKSVEEGYGE